MKIVPKLFVLLMYIALAIAFSTEAFAQWGTGMYGGMQQCAYRAEVGDEAMDIQDDINEMMELKKELKDRIKEKKSDIRRLDRDIERSKTAFQRRGVRDEYALDIYAHIEGNNSCSCYSEASQGSGVSSLENQDFRSIASNDEFQTRMPADSSTPDGTGGKSSTCDGEWVKRADGSSICQGTQDTSKNDTQGRPVITCGPGRVKNPDGLCENSRPQVAGSGQQQQQPPGNRPPAAGGPTAQRPPGGRPSGPPPPPPSQNGIPGASAPGNCPLSAFKYDRWKYICDWDRTGKVYSAYVCAPGYEWSVDKKDFDSKACGASLKDLTDYLGKKRQYDREMEAMTRDLQALEDSIDRMKTDKRKATREYKRELREAMTEGGCVECIIGGSGGYSGQSQSNTWDVIANLGLGLGGMLIGADMQRSMSKTNAKLGFQTQPIPSLGFGYPYFMNAIYGAVGSSLGGGAFGCGSGAGGAGNMNGPMGMMNPFGLGSYGGGGMPWGYPGGMYNPMYGGAMMPGFGPNGYMGPGLGGMFGGGMPFGGGFGFMNGGMMGGGGPMFGGGGFVGGGPLGGMMGSPMGMGGMAGGPFGGGFGFMNGGMMGGGGPMFGGGGGPMFGGGGGPMFGGGGGPMFGGGGGPMFGGGGGPMFGGMAGGMMGLGGPMGNMMSGPMGGGMMGAGMMGGMDQMTMYMQLQQQQMQFQMQQMQAYMQSQQRAQENYMARQRVVMGLQSELQSIMYRLQQAQYGAVGSFDTGPGLGGSFNFSGGVGINNGPGIIPASGSSPGSPQPGGR